MWQMFDSMPSTLQRAMWPGGKYFERYRRRLDAYGLLRRKFSGEGYAVLAVPAND